MANAFTNFLSGVGAGLLGQASGDLKDYQHASRLYVDNGYARAPKLNFLYFIVFNINPTVKSQIREVDKAWGEKHINDVGLLVKRSDLPKFTVSTESLNQYNRKAIVQTKISYNPISIEFHDDNSDITTNLWKNYYNYYYYDGRYAKGTNTKSTVIEYQNTKFTEDVRYVYGFNPDTKEPFFTSIDIYVLHKGKGSGGNDFTQMTLINPLVTEWSHDYVSQDDSAHPMTSRMSLAYETVAYRNGRILKNKQPEGFTPVYYDNTPSPLSVGGGIPGTIFGANGILSGAGEVFGTLTDPDSSPLDYLGAGLKAINVAKGIGKISKEGLRAEGYSILSGTLRDIATTGNQPGSIGSNTRNLINNAGSTIGVKLFGNSSVSGTVSTKPASTTGGGS